MFTSPVVGVTLAQDSRTGYHFPDELSQGKVEVETQAGPVPL